METSFFGKLIPNRNQVFFNLFNRVAGNCVSMAQLLHEAIQDEWIPEQKPQFSQISRLKIQSNQLKRQVYAVSGKSLVSPFERNDMYALTSAINSVADYIDISARRISLYSIEEITPAIKQLAGVILDACQQLEKSIRMLDQRHNTETIITHCKQIKDLEDNADKIHGEAFASLNTQQTDIFHLIKYSEVLGALERTTDKCEHAAYVIENILIKNS